MLKSIHIQHFALIEELDINFREGFSVITGETGSGKSILLGAIGLLLGNRADSRTIQAGASKCVVEAEFSLRGHHLERFFVDNGFDFDEESCLIRRELSAAGKSRAFINDSPASLSQLRELGEQLIDIHSQHQNMLLLQEGYLLDTLDLIAGDGALCERYVECFTAVQSLKKEIEEKQEVARKGREERDYLQFQFQLLEDFDPEDGEEERLEEERLALEHAEEVKGALTHSTDLLEGGDTSLLDMLRVVKQQLHSAAKYSTRAEGLTERVESAYIELKDIAGETAALADNVEYNPQRLQQVLDRLDALYDLMKKHGVNTAHELRLLMLDLERKLCAVDNADHDIEELQARYEKQLSQATRLAESLSQKRQEAALAITAKCNEQLAALGIPNAQLLVDFARTPLMRTTGVDNVTLLFSANKNAPLLPVAQVASGGEIARVMLVLKSITSRHRALPTIIFDEIDTGVSGRIADAMAQMMIQLSRAGAQVIAITHLPQMAAQGDHHYRVYKQDVADATHTHIQPIEKEERVTELAKMLSGEHVTNEAMANARKLLSARALVVLLLLLFSPLCVMGQKWLKKMRPVQVGVIAYDQGGTMHQGQGIRLGQGDVVVTEYDLLKGAKRILITDQKGVETEIEALCGASSLYNVTKLTTEQPINKYVGPTPYSQQLSQGDVVYILPPYNADKKAVAVVDTIRKAETFKDTYFYYTLSRCHSERFHGAAVFTSEGALVGLLQPSAKASGPSAVIDVRFPLEFSLTALSSKNADLQAIDLPLQLPADEEQAATFLFLADRSNATRYVSYIDKFIVRYPRKATGYTTKADFFVQQGSFAAADSTYDAALNVEGVEAGELHFSRANAAYTLALSPQKESYGKWSAQFALDEVRAANAIETLPAYTMLEARCLYTLKQYDAAYEKFTSLASTNMRSPELFMYAAICLQATDAHSDRSIAMMDSAINCYGKPIPTAAAPLLISRAKALTQSGKYREAVRDMNEYEHLAASLQLPADFYYEREQLELKCRMYAPALSDIEQAIRLEPKEPLYQAEAASLNYRVGEIDDAIHYAQQAIFLSGDFADAYRILGVCMKQKGNKAEARRNLEKAKDLGDEVADALLQDL